MYKKWCAAWCCAVMFAPVCFAQGGDFSQNQDVSYAIGVLLAKSLKDEGISVDQTAFSEGVKGALAGTERISQEEALNVVKSAMEVALNQQKAENLVKSERFLVENGKKKGVTTTKSGLQYETIAKGSGTQPQKDSVVVVHYTGMLSDGTVFDSSRERDEPATIPLEQVIPGWAEGIQLMRVGGRAKFFIPPALAYGDESGVQEIPPNSVLIFDVELLEIEGN